MSDRSPRWSRSCRRPRSSGSWCPPATSPAPPSTELLELLDKGDVIIDGGNSRWTDDEKHAALAAEKGIGYIDCGVSGGIWGLENGYALMAGGDKKDIAKVTAGLRCAQARR